MRWRALFEDLEAQLAAAETADLRGEVADRTRRELALVSVLDRLRPAEGSALAVTVCGAGVVHATLLDAGADWLLLEEGRSQELLVPLAAVLGIVGLSGQAAEPGSGGEVERRLDLRWALRGLSRGRTGVVLVLRDGTSLAGTLDRVGADHVDLAEHPAGEARRAGQVRQVRLVPLGAVALIRSG